MVVENRGGATGNIGTAAVVNAQADGCTLLVNATVMATFVYSFAKLSYDPFTDLAPVGGVGVTPTIMVAPPTTSANNIKELVELSKTKPEGLNYSTAGYGLQQHLATEDIMQRTGAKFTHVAYRGGGGNAMNDLMAGRLDFGTFLGGTTKPLIAGGKLKAVAIVAEKRSPLVPEIPTTTEQGLTGMNAGVHFMMFAPAKTPKPVVDRIGAALHQVISEPSLKERFVAIGFDATPMSAGEVTAAMRKARDDYGPIIKRLNVKLD